jgi:membrane protease YdiL (CAAX protease family)
MRDLIKNQHPAPLWLFGLVAAAWLAVYLPANFWFSPSGNWTTWRDATYGLLRPALIVGVAAVILVAGLVLMGIGRFRPSELGLDVAKLPTAIAYTVVVWILMHVATIAVGSTSGKTPEPLHLNGSQAGHLAGRLLAQLAGNALSEEILFRGFLFIQLAMLFERRSLNGLRFGASAAALLSSIVFALAHLPHRIGINGGYADTSAMATDQGWLVVWGCVYCWLYARTKNLWFVVGVHALANARTMLIAAPDVAEYLPLSQMIGVALALVWQRLPGRKRSVRRQQEVKTELTGFS